MILSIPCSDSLVEHNCNPLCQLGQSVSTDVTSVASKLVPQLLRQRKLAGGDVKHSEAVVQLGMDIGHAQAYRAKEMAKAHAYVCVLNHQ